MFSGPIGKRINVLGPQAVIDQILRAMGGPGLKNLGPCHLYFEPLNSSLAQSEDQMRYTIGKANENCWF